MATAVLLALGFLFCQAQTQHSGPHGQGKPAFGIHVQPSGPLNQPCGPQVQTCGPQMQQSGPQMQQSGQCGQYGQYGPCGSYGPSGSYGLQMFPGGNTVQQCAAQVPYCDSQIPPCGYQPQCNPVPQCVQVPQFCAQVPQFGLQVPQCNLQTPQCNIQIPQCNIPQCGIQVSQCGIQVPQCGIQVPQCNIQVPQCGIPNFLQNQQCGCLPFPPSLSPIISPCAPSCDCGSQHALIDNTLANSLANAIQLLIVSNLLESSQCNPCNVGYSPCENTFPCGNVYEFVSPDCLCNQIVTCEPCFQDATNNCGLGNPCARNIGCADSCCGFVNPFGSSIGCLDSVFSPVAAEVVFPSEIPAQLTCNFGYMPTTVPCVSVNVEPLSCGCIC